MNTQNGVPPEAHPGCAQVAAQLPTPSPLVGHTPGPWVVIPMQPYDGDDEALEGAFLPASIEGADGNPVCMFADMTGSGTLFENEADYRLIAAAPDGLALAKNLMRWLMTDAEQSHIGADDMRVYHLDGGILSNLLNEARAFVAKAEGPGAGDSGTNQTGSTTGQGAGE